MFTRTRTHSNSLRSLPLLVVSYFDPGREGILFPLGVLWEAEDLRDGLGMYVLCRAKLRSPCSLSLSVLSKGYDSVRIAGSSDES